MQLRRGLIGMLTSAVVAIATPAFSCQCGWLGEESVDLFERAEHVVRGRVVQFLADGSAPLGDWIPMVAAKIQVKKTIKGPDVGEVLTVSTGYGFGDCGVPDFFLSSLAYDRDIQIEVYELPLEDMVDNRTDKGPFGPKGSPFYYTDMCSYGYRPGVEEQAEWDAE